MQTIVGTVKNGQIVLSEPVLWPEGTEVRVRPIRKASATLGEEGAGQDSKTSISEVVR